MPRATQKSQSMTITLDWSKSTKNTERFDATDEDAPVTAVYVKREAFAAIGSEIPDQISLTVEWQ